MFAGSRVVGVMQVGLVWNKRKEVVFRIECKPDVTKEDSVRMTSERILVVYDAPDILEALVTALDDSGFQTSGAPDGCSAHQNFL
jgi:PleD family two-component response regulator|tara:strand:- start:280 stop:534 length:255 start_codon:yes stop_codon:yes gene_type:complete